MIVGAGSIGLLLGTFFAEANCAVTFIVRREAQAKRINKDGIRRMNKDQTETVCKVKASMDLNKLKDADLVIIAVKYAHLKELLLEIEKQNSQPPLLFIQNGIGHLKIVLETTFAQIAFGTVEHGALKTDDRSVLHNGIGHLTLGRARGASSVLNQVETISTANFPIKVEQDVDHILMRKVLINCMINPLTAILQVKNGELLTNPSSYALFNELYDELADAFPMMKTDLSLDEVIAVCDNTKHNQSSMLTDRLVGRRMEIETIVSAVIERAKLSNKNLPLLSTLEKLLYAIDGKEEM